MPMVTVRLTEDEDRVLMELSKEQHLEPYKVMVQALRVYQLYSLPEDHPESLQLPKTKLNEVLKLIREATNKQDKAGISSKESREAEQILAWIITGNRLNV